MRILQPRLLALLAALPLTGSLSLVASPVEPPMTRTQQAIAMRMCYVDKSDDTFYVKLDRTRSFSACVGGFADEFPCRDVDLMSAVPIQDLGGGRGSDMWGWTDPVTGREIAIYAMTTATAFVDVTDPANPVHLGNLPVPGAFPVQGDVKVYENHAYIVGERSENHGLQVFDLTRLRDVTQPPETFTTDVHYTEFGRAHNLAINEETGFAYGVSTTTCADGLHMVDIRSPRDPQFAGCLDEVGFIHDAQCVIYRGPDADYQGREICVNSGGDSLSIFDVTDKSAPLKVAETDYEGRAFVHQGWLTEDHGYFLLDDEGDEIENQANTKTYIFDFQDLDNPFLIDAYTSTSEASDHNLYIVGDYVFEANYASGLRILRLEDVAAGRLTEVGYFDVVPDADGNRFGGAWTAYPYFKSGNVVISTISQGLFVVRPTFDFQVGDSCHLPLGDPAYCRECGPCAARQGSCRSDADCRRGLTCAENFGRHFGMGANVDVCVTPRSVVLEYAPVEIDAVTGGDVTFDRIHATGLNNAGEVVGWAADAAGRRTAFRTVAGAGPERLEPPGAAGSEALAVNDAGHVFGRLVRSRSDGSAAQTGFFVFRDGDFDLLEQGANQALRAGFDFLDMNDSGDVVGVLRRSREPRYVPYLYTEGAGWISLASLDPRLRERSTLPIAINDAADILFAVEPRPSGAQDAYLLRGGEDLVELGNLGRRVNAPTALNDRGHVVGLSETAESEAHAYFVKPGKALADLHRGRFASSYAGWVSAKSVTGGVFGGEALFTYDARREQKVQVVANRGDFIRLLPAGARFEHLEVIDMNERLEFVGHVDGRLDGTDVRRFFYFSPAAGMADLGEVLRATGSTLDVESVTAINDRGAVLLRLSNGAGGAGAVVLSSEPGR